ncbi:MAG: tyrosine-protein phosphatase [Candidatus Omnitrophica bacterium]|nr:tyrosine-protein phosphatase [Candidatus Omnitrophota bacterium]
MRKIRWASLFFFLIPLIAFAEIPNFHEVEEGFFRGGQPEEAELQALKTLGFRTVVSLRNERSLIRWEEELVEKSGMAFVSIPMTWWKSPTQKQVQTFLDVVRQPERRPLFLHCREGRDRTGAMVALYRIVEARSVEEAYTEAKRYGFREGAIPLKRFILVKAKAFRVLKTDPLPEPFSGIAFLFYAFEGVVGLLSCWGGILCLKRPDLAIRIQKRFYEMINWRLSPVSLEKELRNTRIMGGILLLCFLALVVLLFIFSI